MADDRVQQAIGLLYVLEPADFVVRRKSLVADARTAGDRDAARGIGALRRPTVSAWIVNSLTRSDPAVVNRIRDVGDRLRDAQRGLDRDELRSLTLERRRLVATLVRQAFSTSGGTPSSVVRGEVTATLEAAIADPTVTDAMAEGTLVRAAHWSGFGLAEPLLHAVPDHDRSGENHAPATKPQVHGPDETATRNRAAIRARADDERRSAQEQRREKARRADADLATADRDVRAAEAAETDAVDAVRRFDEQRAAARQRLDEVRLDLRRARARQRRSAAAAGRTRR